MVVKNHVFEDPKVLIRARVIDPSWKKYHNKVIFVSEQKLKAIQSEKDKKTSKWTAEKIEPCHAMFADKTENYHLLTELLSYDEIKFICPGDRDGGTAGQGGRMPLQILADQLTLSQPRGAGISTSPPRFSILGDNEE